MENKALRRAVRRIKKKMRQNPDYWASFERSLAMRGNAKTAGDNIIIPITYAE